MGNTILHIPSVITQSCFVETDKDDQIIDMLKTEIDYFYSLLFLYREQLLEQTHNLLLKNGKRLILDKSATIESVEIELNKFNRCGFIDNSKYDGMRTFIKKLSTLSININLLRKDKQRGVETIKVIKSHSWDSTMLTIDFTKEFIEELIGIEKFFMEVDLSYLIKLSGGKAKSLYLVLKDYSKIGNKNFTKDELMLLIGKIPQKAVLEEIIEQINDKTDIKVSYVEEGVKKKIYKFKINHKVNLKAVSKSRDKTKKSIDSEVMKQSKHKLQQMKDKGQKIGNEEGYLKTIYDNEMEKILPKEVVKSDSEMELERWIETKIDALKTEGSIDYRHNNYLVLKVKNSDIDRIEELFILDDYKIYDRMDYEKNNSITTDSESTMEFIDIFDVKEGVFCSYGQTIRNATYSQILRNIP